MTSATGTSTATELAAKSQALGAELTDTEALAALRVRGVEAAATLPLPSPAKDRPWKYLDVSEIDFDGYAAAGEPAVTLSGGGEGITTARFEHAEGGAKATIERALGSAVSPERSKLTGYHYALLRGGVLVEAPANVEGAEPVRIVHEHVAGGTLATPHTLIVTGPNSRIDVIEEYRSDDGDLVALPVVEILPGPGSLVRYTALHRWGAETRVFSEQRTVTERDASVVALTVALSGRIVKGHLESSLEGRGSSSELYGVTVGSGSEHADFYTLQDHIGPDTRSDLLFKSALGERARSVYYGITRVGLEARNADANQENRNLLLSRKAMADSDPVLEILTNDVQRVSHGATAGPVDDEQLFYLRSRGLTPAAAVSLLVRGFLGEVLDRVPDEAEREALAALVDEKLGAIA